MCYSVHYPKTSLQNSKGLIANLIKKDFGQQYLKMMLPPRPGFYSGTYMSIPPLPIEIDSSPVNFARS